MSMSLNHTMIPIEPNINQHPDDYHMSSRKRQHRIHYSRIKSAAIAASYRLMHVSTDNVLVRKTANAAVNGMRPQYVAAAQEHKQQIEPDIVDDFMYNHKKNIEAIADLCLVKEPRRNRDREDFKPPSGYEFVLLSTLSQENKRKPILCGSGEKYYLCYRRRTAPHERVLTDIQITFKATIPLGYQPLNYLFDGTQLPYFQRKEESEEKDADLEKEEKKSQDIHKKEEKKDPHEEKKENNEEPAEEEEEEEVLSFDNIPLIIFSKTGGSEIIDVQLKELGTKLREGLISIDRSLDDNVANLNKGTADTTIHPIYISYANDLIKYRFSALHLSQHINLKFLTPLLISLHLRKADLAMTSIDSLKYLLLSNFIRFRDNNLMRTALQTICAAVSQSVVTFDTAYHDKLMEIQIIIFQKFIHHLPPTCLWSMLISSLIPLKFDLPKKFLKKYIETSFSYVRILEFGDSLDETGNIQLIEKKQNQKLRTYTPGKAKANNMKSNLFAPMKHFVTDLISQAVDYSVAERALIDFYHTDLYSQKASELVGACGAALFIDNDSKAWKPLATMIIFLTRISMINDTANKLEIRSCRYCTRLLEKIIDTACNEEYIHRMPAAFKYLLRRTISRTICHNLCHEMRVEMDTEDIFNANLRFFEKICLCWYAFFQHEIGVILTQVILPQVLERFTPFRRRQKFLSCISRILLNEKTLIHLVYSLDIINATRCIHGIVDSLIGILIETAAILKHDKPTFEIADQSAKSYTNNYNFHHLAIQCLTFLCKSYSIWFNREIIKKNWSSQYLSQCVMDANKGRIEARWQTYMAREMVNLRAKDIACNTEQEKSEKAVKNAIALLIEEKIISNNAVQIVSWLHKNRHDIPQSNIGHYLGGGRPKEERPWEEAVRLCYFRQCDMNFAMHIEELVHVFLTKCGFRLPGEAQKIGRMLESFAVCYWQARREIWRDSDSVFVVLNAILMLNTSLHNPHIKDKDKLKKSVFLGMCLGVKGQSLVSADYERVFIYIERNAYEISFEDEANMSKKRQFDEWKQKNILNARRPLVAYTQALKQEIKKLSVFERAKSSMHMKVSHSQTALHIHSGNPHHHPLHKSYTFSNSVNLKHVHSNHMSVGATPEFFNELAHDYYHATGGGPDALYNGNMADREREDDDIESKEDDFSLNVIIDDDDDDKLISDEQKEIEAEMKSKFEQHIQGEKAADELEYFRFCEEIAATAGWWLRDCANKSSDLVHIDNNVGNNNVELGCLLIDNWWSRILDALKIVFELTDDPYTTPLVLSILPHFLQITLTLGAFGHSTCKIAFNGILYRYKIWWLRAILRMDEDTKSKNPSMAKESDLKLIENKIWEKPQKYYEKLKLYILASQHIVHSRTIWLRLRDLQFEFSDVHFMLKSREFIGEQTILKMGARDTTYRLFFFSDMLLYANGRPGKYRSHRVLLLIFCALEDLKDSRNVRNAFRIHSPQKSITIALPNNEYKRICFKKINELIVKQRKKVRQLIQQLLRKHQENKLNKSNNPQIGDKYLKLAEKFQSSSAFLHQTLSYIAANKIALPNNCKLCLTAFNRMGRRKKECPICNDYVCPKCIQRKARNPKTSKRRNVCDGCLDIVEGRLRL